MHIVGFCLIALGVLAVIAFFSCLFDKSGNGTSGGFGAMFLSAAAAVVFFGVGLPMAFPFLLTASIVGAGLIAFGILVAVIGTCITLYSSGGMAAGILALGGIALVAVGFIVNLTTYVNGL